MKVARPARDGCIRVGDRAKGRAIEEVDALLKPGAEGPEGDGVAVDHLVRHEENEVARPARKRSAGVGHLAESRPIEKINPSLTEALAVGIEDDVVAADRHGAEPGKVARAARRYRSVSVGHLDQRRATEQVDPPFSGAAPEKRDVAPAHRERREGGKAARPAWNRSVGIRDLAEGAAVEEIDAIRHAGLQRLEGDVV